MIRPEDETLLAELNKAQTELRGKHFPKPPAGEGPPK
jgi:hypothetical protein